MWNSSTGLLTQKAEIKFSRFLAEHNLPIATDYHLSECFPESRNLVVNSRMLVKECFPDLRIVQSY